MSLHKCKVESDRRVKPEGPANGVHNTVCQMGIAEFKLPGEERYRSGRVGRRESGKQDHGVLQTLSAQHTQQASKTSQIRLNQLRRRLVQRHRRARAQRESRLHAYRRRCHRLRHALKGKKRRIQLHFHF